MVFFSACRRRPTVNGEPIDVGLVGDVVSVDARSVEDPHCIQSHSCCPSVAPDEDDVTKCLMLMQILLPQL